MTALVERYDEAREYYQAAIKVRHEMRFRPESVFGTCVSRWCIPA